MIRLKYVLDDWVFINDGYQATFADFAADCIALGIANPLTEFTYILYTPSRGTETIDSEGRHAVEDEISNDDCDIVITEIQQFIDQKQLRDFPIPTLAELLVTKIEEAKGEASRRILNISPLSDQINSLAEVLEITNKENASRNDVDNNVPGASVHFPTAQEKAVILSAQIKYIDIKAVRTKSNTIEASFNSMDFDALNAFDVRNDAHWN